jgi:hypothetical protein
LGGLTTGQASAGRYSDLPPLAGCGLSPPLITNEVPCYGVDTVIPLLVERVENRDDVFQFLNLSLISAA